MDVEHHRVLLGGVEAGRFDDPTLRPGPVGGVVPEFLHLAELDPGEHVVVHRGDLGGPGRVGNREHHDIGGLVEGGPGGRRDTRRRDGVHGEQVGALGQRAGRSVERGHVEIPRAAVVGGEEDPVALGRPDRVVGVPVEARREGAHRRSVEPDHLEVADLVGLLGPVETAEGDVLAVGRNHRTRPGTALVRDLADGAACEIHEVDVRLPVSEVGVLLAGRVEDQSLAVRGPVETRPVVEPDRAPRTHVPGAFGELARRPAVSGDDEEVPVALLEEPHPILPEVHLPGRSAASSSTRRRPGRSASRGGPRSRGRPPSA